MLRGALADDVHTLLAVVPEGIVDLAVTDHIAAKAHIPSIRNIVVIQIVFKVKVRGGLFVGQFADRNVIEKEFALAANSEIKAEIDILHRKFGGGTQRETDLLPSGSIFILCPLAIHTVRRTADRRSLLGVLKLDNVQPAVGTGVAVDLGPVTDLVHATGLDRHQLGHRHRIRHFGMLVVVGRIGQFGRHIAGNTGRGFDQRQRRAAVAALRPVSRTAAQFTDLHIVVAADRLGRQGGHRDAIDVDHGGLAGVTVKHQHGDGDVIRSVAVKPYLDLLPVVGVVQAKVKHRVGGRSDLHRIAVLIVIAGDHHAHQTVTRLRIGTEIQFHRISTVRLSDRGDGGVHTEVVARSSTLTVQVVVLHHAPRLDTAEALRTETGNAGQTRLVFVEVKLTGNGILTGQRLTVTFGRLIGDFLPLIEIAVGKVAVLRDQRVDNGSDLGHTDIVNIGDAVAEVVIQFDTDGHRVGAGLETDSHLLPIHVTGDVGNIVVGVGDAVTGGVVFYDLDKDLTAADDLLEIVDLVTLAAVDCNAVLGNRLGNGGVVRIGHIAAIEHQCLGAGMHHRGGDARITAKHRPEAKIGRIFEVAV